MSEPQPPRSPAPVLLLKISRPASATDKVLCERCGAEMYRMHAVWRCSACGFKTDCCGWWMHTLPTAINPDDDTFKANREQMQRLVAELQGHLARAREGGGAKYLQRHRDQGKLPVRDRIQRLLDAGSPFLELSGLAAFGMY